jgi:hypothetical protein
MGGNFGKIIINRHSWEKWINAWPWCTLPCHSPKMLWKGWTKNHRKSDTVELERKATNSESEEVARWSLIERWRLGVAWPESDSGPLVPPASGRPQFLSGSFGSSCMCGSASRLLEKTFYRALLLWGGFSRKLSIEHCCWTVWITAKKWSNDANKNSWCGHPRIELASQL